jgi:hypothetical protein
MFPTIGFVLADVIFPVFMFYFFPPLLGIAAIANLIIDAAVFFVTLHFFRIKLKNSLGTLLMLWLFGLVADIAGSLFLCLTLLLNRYVPQISINYIEIFSSPAAIALILTAVLIAGLIIYCLDRIFLKNRIPVSQAKRIALVLAIVTAPYTFLIPTNWFLGA